MEHQIGETVGGEIADADGMHQTFFTQLGECAPGAKNIIIRILQEQQIDGADAETVQRTLAALFCFFIGGVGDGELGRDKNILAFDAALSHGATDGALVAIALRCIDETIAQLQRFAHCALARFLIEHARADPDHWHLNTIVEDHGIHLRYNSLVIKRGRDLCTHSTTLRSQKE